MKRKSLFKDQYFFYNAVTFNIHDSVNEMQLTVAIEAHKTLVNDVSITVLNY